MNLTVSSSSSSLGHLLLTTCEPLVPSLTVGIPGKTRFFAILQLLCGISLQSKEREGEISCVAIGASARGGSSANLASAMAGSPEAA